MRSNLALSVADAGMSRLVTFTEYKADWRGRRIEKIDPWFPSTQNREYWRARSTMVTTNVGNSGCPYRSSCLKASSAARIGIEDVTQVARIIAPRALELVDLPPQDPFDHRSSPSLALCGGARVTRHARTRAKKTQKDRGGRPTIGAHARASRPGRSIPRFRPPRRAPETTVRQRDKT
jgi:hypothetical protein